MGFLVGLLLWALSLGIYLFTLYLAYLTSFLAMILTLMFPFIGQIYWLWFVWGATGVFFNWLTIACLVWVAAVAVVVGGAMISDRRR